MSCEFGARTVKSTTARDEARIGDLNSHKYLVISDLWRHSDRINTPTLARYRAVENISQKSTPEKARIQADPLIGRDRRMVLPPRPNGDRLVEGAAVARATGCVGAAVDRERRQQEAFLDQIDTGASNAAVGPVQRTWRFFDRLFRIVVTHVDTWTGVAGNTERDCQSISTSENDNASSISKHGWITLHCSAGSAVEHVEQDQSLVVEGSWACHRSDQA